MKEIRRFVSFLLALVMVIGMVPPMAVSAEETEPTQSVTEATENTSAAEPAEETTAPAETVAEATEETTASVEAVTELTEEAAAYAAETEQPAEEEIPEPVLTYRVLCETENGWTLEEWDETTNGGLYGEDDLTFSPGEYCLAFYLNTWDPESGSWEHTPVHVEFGKYLSGELLEEEDYTFLPDAEGTGYYYHVVVSESVDQETASIVYECEGVEVAMEVGLGAIEELEWETIESIQDDIELTDILISDNASYMSASVARRDVINPNGIDGQAIVNKAREWMNKSPKPLRYDGTNFNSRTGFTSPPSFDCSGFIFRVCYDIGLTSTHKPYDFSKQDSHGNYYITSDTHNQKLYGDSLTAAVNDYKQTGSVSGFCAGDLLFLDYDGDNVTDHVGIYTSGGKVIHSSSSNSLVETPLSQGGWYGKTMGAWLYAAARLIPLCSHPKYIDNGICSTCKQKFNWTLDLSTAGVYSVVKEFTPRSGGPYDADTKDTSKTFSAGSKVTVFGSLKNAYGNLWYQIGYGDGKVGYVFHEYLKISSDPLIVKYNANGGSGAPGNQTKVYGSTLTLSSTKPTRAGYTFLGWSTSSTATSATYAAGGSYTSNASATLYAVWQKHSCQKGKYLWKWDAHPHYSCYTCTLCGEEMAAYDEPNYDSSCETCNPPEPTYTITLNPNNGSCSVPSITVTKGKAIGTLPTPTRSGYIFEGWYTSGGTHITADSTFTGNTTIYASWNTDYVNIGENFYAYLSNKSSGLGVCNVDENVQLGTANVKASTWLFLRQSDGSYEIRSAVDLLSMDVYNNETENGTNVWVYPNNESLAQRWFVRAVDGGGYILIAANSGKALDVNGGTLKTGTNIQIYEINNTAAQLLTITKVYPTISSSASSITLKVGENKTIDITKNGYYAGNWNFSRSLSNNNVRTVWGDWKNSTCPITITGLTPGVTTITFVLKDWDTNDVLDTITVDVTVQSDDYVVSFDPANGDSVTKMTVKPGGSITAPSNIPYKLGHTFLGWGFSDGAVQLHPGEQFTVGSNLSFYAIWQDAIEILSSTDWIYCRGTATPLYGDLFYSFTPSVTASYLFHSGDISDSFRGDVFILDTQSKNVANGASSAEGEPFRASCILTAGTTYYITFHSTEEDIPFVIERGYNVRYDANNGLNAPQSTYSYYLDGMTISSMIPTRTDYSFLGWSTDKNATSAEYFPNEKVYFKTDAILYAVWEKKAEELKPADVNRDGKVNDLDAVYLLWHALFPNEYPIYTHADFDGNKTLNGLDAEYLLWHTLFPGLYPLQ